MVKHTIPHLEAIFQELDYQIQDLGTFISHIYRLQEDLRQSCKTLFREAENLSQDDQD